MRGDRWTWLAVPALLVAVALLQYRNVAVDDESTWSGVGFGMFATFDNETTRAVRISVTLDGREVPASRSALGHREFNLKTLPSAGELRGAGASLLDERWEVVDGVALLTDENGRRASAVRVEVIGMRVGGTPEAPVITTELIRAVEVGDS